MDIFDEFKETLDEETEDKKIEEEIKKLYTLEFELSWEQINAIKKIIKFVNSKADDEDFIESHKILLTGGPGVGKTSVISQVIAYLNNHEYDYIACAPTHKARINLEKLTKTGTLTLHQLLLLRPNLEIALLDIKELEFQSGLTDNWRSHIPRLVIIDECSMITSDLYSFIDNELIKKRGVKVIFLGDSAQLKGVNESNISEVFNIKNKIELTKIYRQKEEAPLLYILQDLRVKPKYSKFNEFKSEYGNLYCCKDTKEFIVSAAKEYRKAIKDGDLERCKVITYTNNRIDSYNTVFNNILFNNDNEYSVGGFLTGYDNYDTLFGKIYNSLDYIIKQVTPTIKKASDIFHMDLPGYNLILEDTIYGGDLNLFMLSNKIDQKTLSTFIHIFENTRLNAIKVNKKKDPRLYGTLWKKYYALSEYFASPFNLYYEGRMIKSATLKHGYALSVHKIQGSSIDNIYVDMRDIRTCRDEEELRQLQYVALSRTRNNIYLLE